MIEKQVSASGFATVLAIKVPRDISAFRLVKIRESTTNATFVAVEVVHNGVTYRLSGHLPKALAKRFRRAEEEYAKRVGQTRAQEWHNTPSLLKSYRLAILNRLIRIRTEASTRNAVRTAATSPSSSAVRRCKANIIRNGKVERCGLPAITGSSYCHSHRHLGLLNPSGGALVMSKEPPRTDELIKFVERYRVLNGKPFSLERYPFLLQIYRDLHTQSIVIMKGAQMGITEYAMNRAIWFVMNKNENVLITQPTRRDAAEFVQTRLDPTLQQFEEVFKATPEEIRRKWVDNKRIKQIGERFIYVRGTIGESEAASIPVGFRIHDEVDRSNWRVIQQYRSRLEASEHKWELFISTPTHARTGIHKLFEDSDQHHAFYLCECGHATAVCCMWAQLLELGDFLCPQCKRKIDRTKLVWRPLNPGARRRGYHLSHLINPARSAEDILALREDYEDERDFYNFVLGLPYDREEDRLTLQMLEQCQDGRFHLQTSAPHSIMGVDQNGGLYIVILRIIRPGYYAVIWVERKDGTRWEELDFLMRQYSVQTAVVDHMPNRISAIRFAQRYPGRVWLGFYHDRFHERDLAFIPPKDDNDYPRVAINRNIWFERLFDLISRKAINFPVDDRIRLVFAHLRRVRKETREVGGEQRIRYVRTGADHYAHALLYAIVAAQRVARRTIRIERLTQEPKPQPPQQKPPQPKPEGRQADGITFSARR